MKNKLVLENGREFYGLNFGSSNEVIGEIFFSTSMVGYQELLSDPSYYGKIVCLSYPLIGNYGLADEDYEYKNIHIKGYVVGENNDNPSNFRFTRTLSEAMSENNVTGIEGLDTREIIRLIRNNGIMKAMICDASKPLETCLQEINNYQDDDNLLKYVSCKKTWYSRTTNPSYSFVVLDLGVKRSFIKDLNEYGINVTVVPFNTSADQIKKIKPDAIIISNGPGNPNKLNEIISKILELKGKIPILGLGLGAELIALAYGCKVEKMKHGHHGNNIPVKNINKIDITSQNHFYSIKLNENASLNVTHRSVIDDDIEGFEDSSKKIYGYHINYAKTLNDADNIILQFIKNIEK